MGQGKRKFAWLNLCGGSMRYQAVIAVLVLQIERQADLRRRQQ